MNLPNYFLADLPPEAELSPVMITEACRALRRNREQYLESRTTADLIRVLDGLARNWLRLDDPFRRLALELGPGETGFQAPTLASGLDALFGQLTADNLRSLLAQELGHEQRLDGLCSTGPEEKSGRSALARGPELLVHVAAGNIPNPTILSIVLGLLTRSAQFVKCARGAALLPRLFAHSLYEIEPKLGACLEVGVWRGGDEPLEAALFAEANCVTATGSDAMLASVRGRLPSDVRFLGYGHRVSFGYVTRDACGAGIGGVVEHAAEDVVAWNQQGCLSPHVVYVESGGPVSAEKFAELLAGALEERERTSPRGPVDTAAAATIASRRGFYEVRAAHSPDTRVWCSRDSTAWTVVFEADPRFQLSCLNRFVYVKGARDLDEALEGAESVRGKVSTVGLAAPEGRMRELAAKLGAWGVTRICPLGRMQQPPLAWRHDGRPALADLVTWTDCET